MSELRVNFIEITGAITAAALAQAGVCYDQTTPQILDSQNVTSVTDRSTGFFTVNITSAFEDANYGCGKIHSMGSSEQFTIMSFDTGTAPTASTADFELSIVTGGNQDRDTIDIVFVGDLA